MDLAQAVREALENQVFEHEPGQAALVLREAVGKAGPEAVAAALLDAASVALRRMVVETDEAFDHDELIERLALDGAVPKDSLDVLGRMLVVAAATAGGLRPQVDPLVAEFGPQRALFGAWLATLAVIRVVAINLERTEADLTEEIIEVISPVG